MRKFISILIVAAIAACTPAQQAATKTDTVIAVKTAVCSSSDWVKAKAILADKTTSEELKLFKLAIEVGPDVFACLMQAKAATTTGSGS